MGVCAKCGFAPKDSRKLYLSAWTQEWLCDNATACAKRAAKATR